jgi:hypothetical protein
VRIGGLFLAALIAAASPGVARADDAGEALEVLERGTEQFRTGDLEAARKSFQRARELVPDKANPYRWLGLVEARLNHCKEAVENLDQFLQRVPPNDPRTAEAVTVRDRCREELAPKIGNLIIESTPDGAEVRLDDEQSAPAGVTPFTNPATPAGPHVVFLTKQGYRRVTRGFKVGRGETVRLDFSLQEAGVPPAAIVVPAPTVTRTPAPVETTRRPRYWIAGVVVGAVAVAALAVGLGVGLSGAGSNEAVLPAIRGAP